MALIKLSNNGVKNITSVGNVGTGDLVFISKQTASSSASISFTSGIDSTYKEYVFYFNNLHPANDGVDITFNLSTDSGSNYNVSKVTTYFTAYQLESDATQGLIYDSSNGDMVGTGFANIHRDLGNGNDESLSGYFHLFNPSSSVFVKHFMSSSNLVQLNDQCIVAHVAGYGNTTNPVDAIQFKASSGNIDSGDILLYGVN
tara:strand:+ start:538 stop:1140 length:603 start_codon:yes stop_codon:yes gene_type:complete